MNKQDKDCYNCGVAEDMRRDGDWGERACIYAKQVKGKPCRGWKPMVGECVDENRKWMIRGICDKYWYGVTC